jgi:hypothetical protein
LRRWEWDARRSRPLIDLMIDQRWINVLAGTLLKLFRLFHPLLPQVIVLLVLNKPYLPRLIDIAAFQILHVGY